MRTSSQYASNNLPPVRFWAKEHAITLAVLFIIGAAWAAYGFIHLAKSLGDERSVELIDDLHDWLNEKPEIRWVLVTNGSWLVVVLAVVLDWCRLPSENKKGSEQDDTPPEQPRVVSPSAQNNADLSPILPQDAYIFTMTLQKGFRKVSREMVEQALKEGRCSILKGEFMLPTDTSIEILICDETRPGLQVKQQLAGEETEIFPCAFLHENQEKKKVREQISICCPQAMNQKATFALYMDVDENYYLQYNL